MEDPVKFDVFACVIPGRTDDAVAHFRKVGVYDNELAIRKEVNRFTTRNEPIKILGSVSWSRAKSSEDEFSWARNILLYQEGYRPNDETAYCIQHNLFYGGVLGCHVCSGFYVR